MALLLSPTRVEKERESTDSETCDKICKIERFADFTKIEKRILKKG